MYKKIYLPIAILFGSIISPLVYGSCSVPTFSVDNICINQSCTITETRNASYEARNTFYLSVQQATPVAKIDSWIMDELSSFVEGPGKLFSIDRFCEGGTDDCQNKDFTLFGLLEYNQSFFIDKSSWNNWNNYIEYSSGIDYFFKNHNTTLTNARGSIVNKSLDDVIPNLIQYNDEEFRFKNVCEDDNCKSTSIKNYRLDSTESFTLLEGYARAFNSNYASFFGFVSGSDTFGGHSFTAGQNIAIDFAFQDNVELLDSCNQFTYSYDISYAYLGFNGEGERKIALTDSFQVNQEGALINNTAVDNQGIIKKINAGVSVSNDSGSFRANMNEKIILTKAGKINFYIKIKDNFGNVFEEPLNLLPIDIFPATPNISESSFTLVGYDPSKSYYSEDTFIVHAFLKDSYGNNYYDSVEGIQIGYADTSILEKVNFFNGTDYALGPVRQKNYGSEDNPYFEFKMHFLHPGYYEQGIILSIPIRNENGLYSGAKKDIILKNLENGAVQTIYIKKIAGSSDFALVCTNNKLVLETKCVSDNLSGCNPVNNGSVSFSEESANGESGRLIIKDFAGNQESFAYSIDHIDKTAPSITVIGLDFGSKKAFDLPLSVQFFDTPPSGCPAGIKYRIYINGVLYSSASTTQKNINIDLNTSDFIQKSGDYNVRFESEDLIGNIRSIEKVFTIVPDNISPSNSLISLIGSLDGGKIANNFDYYNYSIQLKDTYGNTIKNKEIVSFQQNVDFYTNGKIITTLDGSDALGSKNMNTHTNGLGVFMGAIKSVAPGVFTENFKLQVYNWDDSYDDTDIKDIYLSTGNENSFGKLYDGNIQVSNDGGISWGATPAIGQLQLYKIGVNKLSSEGSTNNVNLDVNRNSVINNIAGHIWGKFVDIGIGSESLLSGGSYQFQGQIDANSNILLGPKVGGNDLNITYDLGGKQIRYPLDNFEVVSCDKDGLGLRVIGKIQGSDKANITGQDNNFSDLYKADVRINMRKNAYQYINNMTSGDTVGGVKYVEGDITLGGDNLGYETLIVKNGNVFISADLNDSDNTLGIIVLQDNYNIETDYNVAGNIYIANSVSYISANIYLDGTMRSATIDGDDYNDIFLGEKLEFFGTLFSRNTIGGAISAGSYYTLPGGRETSNIDLAAKYDLNFMRKSEFCGSDYSVLMRYNPAIQRNPPKIFSQ